VTARQTLASALLVALGWASIAAAQTPAAPQAPAAPPMSLADGAAIVEALGRGPAQGLAEPDVTADLALLPSPDPAVSSAADAALSAAAIRLARDEHGGRIDPLAVNSDWALKAPYDPAADFAQARVEGRIGAWAAALAPKDGAYLALMAARARYAAIVAQGGWQPVPDGPPLKPGAEDPRILALRSRLAVEGYAAPPTKTPDVLDPGLDAALALFQARHGLKPDGVLVAATTTALNVTADARLAAIDLNLERARWLPDPLPPERIEVDIAATEAVLFQDGAPALSMRAIVGDLRHHTPSLASKVDAIVFNPPWIVPTSIAAQELYPKERRSPGYFARNAFSVVNGQLIQKAGPKSALGYVKFDIPTPFGVYLHDTPARSLFKRDARWLSHGCMRLEQPRQLAAILMAPQGWTAADVDAAIAAGATVRYPLKVQPPVYVVYRTVTADADGAATFRPDVYGWDAELAGALAGR
jgi:murein L,D-transpeptidase YcbB/YkuD